jgi:glycosyltransferase involved in cell wall biosynthesis
MPRFSLVLTTCDRPSLLAAGVRAALDTHFQDLELIVSDNFSQISAAELLKDVDDPRLRIIRTDRRLPASDHWEFAFDFVKGEFVMYVGDDNALRPDILALADHAIRRHDLDLISWRACSYFHPDWDITYGGLPNRGNVLGVDVGTTGEIYVGRPEAVLTSYAENLRLSGCFPCMMNCLFRKSVADMIRKRSGSFFWAPSPDISSSFFMLGAMRQSKYGFYDSVGAIGGRSKQSNLATLLSRGKSSRRAYDYLAEFSGKDILPKHEPKFVSMSNAFASTISQSRMTMPECFGAYRFDRKTLARRTLEDMYVDRTIPWVDDPEFVKEVDAFIGALPAADAAEIAAYRDELIARLKVAEAAGDNGPNYIRNSQEARASLLRIRLARGNLIGLAWRLFRQTGRNPLGKHWVSGNTTYIDMSLYGGHDIADAARHLPAVLANFDKHGDGFVNYHRQIGMIGDRLDSGSVGQPSSASSNRPAEAMA